MTDSRPQKLLRPLSIGLLAMISLALTAPHASAQQQPKANETPKASEAQRKKPPQKQQLKLPDEYKLNMLIRTSLLTLNDAIRSGNYTVLRDLSAPDFQAANSSAKLADIFSKLRERNLDFSPIILFNPKLIRPPQFTKNGLLRLTGFMPTTPEQVNFDLAYQLVGRDWRLFAISVNTSPGQVVASNSDGDNKKADREDTKATDGKSNLETNSNRNVAGIGDVLDKDLLPVRRPDLPAVKKPVAKAKPKKEKSNTFWPFNN